MLLRTTARRRSAFWPSMTPSPSTSSPPSSSCRRRLATPAASRPSPSPLGTLDVNAVTARLEQEFKKRSKEDPVKNPLPTEDELQQDFDALIEARAIQLIKSRSSSFSVGSGGGSPFLAADGHHSPHRSDSPGPNGEQRPNVPALSHAFGGLAMTSSTPSHPSPLTITTAEPYASASSSSALEDLTESALSSGIQTPVTAEGSRPLSRRPSTAGSRRASQPGSRRPSIAPSRKPSMRRGNMAALGAENPNPYESR